MGSVVRRSVFLTGATGFLGKVVLFELLRRSEELAIDRVRVLVRSKRGEGGAARFRRKVLSSPCLAALAPGLERKIEVVEGDLERPRFGISAEAWKAASDDTTEVIHCAASIDFHRPVAEAERANVEAALRALDFARAAGARRCVSVSTAYVTPHPARPVPVRERLAPLPVPASRLRREIRAGRYDSPRAEAALLRRTGHPNTYTLTKCLAEHLLAQASHDLPLTIVRPSIVGPAFKTPWKPVHTHYTLFTHHTFLGTHVQNLLVVSGNRSAMHPPAVVSLARLKENAHPLTLFVRSFAHSGVGSIPRPRSPAFTCSSAWASSACTAARTA